MVLEKNFISPRLQGRTGNMMFQVAHAYAKSLEYNRQLVILKESLTVPKNISLDVLPEGIPPLKPVV